MNIRELARLVGVSKSTVSLALRNDPSIPEKTRTRVHQAAKKYGYRPNPKLSEVMASLARRESVNLVAPLALLSMWQTPRAWETMNLSFLRRCREGCLVRAGELGFSLEEFWLGAPGMTPGRMRGILNARGIEGVLIFSYPQAPAVLEMDLSDYAAVVIGRALVRPRVHAIDIDHFHGFFVAWNEIMRKGYRRPALFISGNVDERTEHSWSAAYRFARSSLKESYRVPILSIEDMDGRSLLAWLSEHRPDVAMVADTGFFRLFEEAAIRIPDDLAALVLFQTERTAGFAGIDGYEERIGERAVEMLAEQLRLHRRGVPSAPETVLMDGVWRDGSSLP